MLIRHKGAAFATTMLASLALMSAGSAQAQLSGKIWEGDFSNDAHNIPAGTPDVTFTSPGINFSVNDSDNQTIGDWLNFGAPATILTGAGELGKPMDDTLVELTGNIYLSAGVNSFVVSHDDGLTIDIAGIGRVLDKADPTSPVDTDFDINAPSAGIYDFTLEYNETDGGPGVLQLSYPQGGPVTGSVPDATATLGLLGLSFTSLAAAARKLKK